MKINQSTLLALVTSVASVGLMVACGGGGGGYSQPIKKVVVIVTSPTGDGGSSGSGGFTGSGGSSSGSAGSTGSGGTTGSGGSTGSGGYSGSGGTSGDAGGCDASGCNSFGKGGTKNTGLQAHQLNQAQLSARATAVAAQFQMSYDSAYKITQLANQVQMMQTQGQLTAADQEAVVESAFAVAGVTSDQVNAAIAKSTAGDNSGVEDVMSQAATNLGMPSGATFRDKVLPLFTDDSTK